MEIFRTESADEKKDFKAIRINKEDVFDKFRKKISDKEREYSKQRKPYCARCAKLDFKNSNEERARQMEIKIGYIDFEKFKPIYPDLEEYGKEDRFILLKESDAMEPTRNPIPGTIQRKVKIGIHRDFQCKVCGDIDAERKTSGRISLFIPNEELESSVNSVK